jgi:pimeloyl-ACP methyl ester carboxylesterase
MSYFKLEEDVQLYYEERGEGQPILFIHGLWCSGRFFKNQISFLGERYRTIAIDMRGHGRSSHVHHGHTCENYANDVNKFIVGLGLENVIIAGWSMGALVTLSYFKQFSDENIKAFVLIDQSASDYKWPDWQFGFDFPTLCYVMSALQTDRAALIREIAIPKLFKDLPEEVDLKWVFDELSLIPESIANTILFNEAVQDYREVLPDVTVPTLLCFGKDDKTVPFAAGEHLEKNIPNARLLGFENSCHCPFLEEPDKFNKEVDQFIQSLG